MIFDENEIELEVDEMMSLLRKWGEMNNVTVYGLTDHNLLDLINYYYPLVEIVEEKYITNMRCILWDKTQDIISALNQKQLEIRLESNILIANIDRPISPSSYKSISIYDMYQYYCKYMALQNTKNVHLNNIYNRGLVVSKLYFDKYIQDNMAEYILDDNFISPDWYLL